MRRQVQHAGTALQSARRREGAAIPLESAVAFMNRDEFPWWISQRRDEWWCVTCRRRLHDDGCRITVWHVRSGHVVELRTSSTVPVAEPGALSDERERREGRLA